MEIIDQDWLNKALLEVNFVESFAKVNPHSPGAINALEKSLAIKANRFRSILLEKFPEINEKIIFQNVIALAYENPYLLMCVWRTLLDASNLNNNLVQ